MGLAAADHQRKFMLGKPLLLPPRPDRRTKGDTFLVCIHALSVCGILTKLASYMKSIGEGILLGANPESDGVGRIWQLLIG